MRRLGIILTLCICILSGCSTPVSKTEEMAKAYMLSRMNKMEVETDEPVRVQVCQGQIEGWQGQLQLVGTMQGELILGRMIWTYKYESEALAKLLEPTLFSQQEMERIDPLYDFYHSTYSTLEGSLKTIKRWGRTAHWIMNGNDPMRLQEAALIYEQHGFQCTKPTIEEIKRP